MSVLYVFLKEVNFEFIILLPSISVLTITTFERLPSFVLPQNTCVNTKTISFEMYTSSVNFYKFFLNKNKKYSKIIDNKEKKLVFTKKTLFTRKIEQNTKYLFYLLQ